MKQNICLSFFNDISRTRRQIIVWESDKKGQECADFLRACSYERHADYKSACNLYKDRPQIERGRTRVQMQWQLIDPGDRRSRTVRLGGKKRDRWLSWQYHLRWTDASSALATYTCIACEWQKSLQRGSSGSRAIAQSNYEEEEEEEGVHPRFSRKRPGDRLAGSDSGSWSSKFPDRLSARIQAGRRGILSL